MSYDKNVAQQYAELGTKCRTKPPQKKKQFSEENLGFQPDVFVFIEFL